MTERRVLVCALAATAVVAGCSTLVVADGYALPDDSVAIELPVPDGRVQVGFVPLTRLHAVGALGIPVLPTKVKTGDQTEFVLSVRLSLNSRHEFSFSTQHCLATDSGASLCSDQILVNAKASRRDKQGYWQKLPAFYGYKDYYQPLVSTAGSQVINDQDLYDLYGYDSIVPWEYFDAELLYRFTCHAECPKAFTLDGSRLVRIDGDAVDVGITKFHARRFKDYDAAAVVQ